MNHQTVYFVRHGEADYNLLDRVNAHPDVRNNLTVTGKAQAACCCKALADVPIELIYCSEFPRARQTAEIVNEHFGVPLVVDPLINETGAFAFEGKPARLWHQAQVPDRLSALVPGCEPFMHMKQRLSAFLEKLREVPQQHIVVVSHEEPIQVMLGILEKIPDAVARKRPISHCLPIHIQLAPAQYPPIH
jgi:broad specificity phosphatase PhoE